MKLTPIKIRGKKRRAGHKTASASLSRLSQQLPGPQPNKRQKLKTRMKKPPPTPPLQRLPVEILERILVFSQNPSFARITPQVGVMLSGKKTLMDFVIAAFGPTWDDWFGQDLREIVSYAGFTDPACIAGDPAFQSAVLACPWATSSLILDAQQLWLTRATRLPPRGSSASLAEEYFTNKYSSFNIEEAFSKQVANLRQDPADKSLSNMAVINSQTRLIYHIHVHPQTTIPDTLFSAPFTHAKAELLAWLVVGNAKLQPSQTWELTAQGFYELWAMTGDVRLKLMLIDLFFRLDVLAQWPYTVREDTRLMMVGKPGAPENPGREIHHDVLQRIHRYMIFPHLAAFQMR